MSSASVINGFISSAHTTPGLLDTVMIVLGVGCLETASERSIRAPKLLVK